VAPLEQSRQHADMDPPEPTRVVIELQDRGRVPAGLLYTADERPIRFEGWLDLLDALLRAISDAPPERQAAATTPGA
jgi:hypothetical protein